MKLDFVTIAVKNLEESVQFYKEVLELKEIKRINPSEGINIVFLKDKDSSVIELLQHSMKNEIIKDNHISRISITFRVEDLSKTLKILESKKIKVTNGPMEKFVFIHDPNGVEIGLRQDM